MSSRDGETPRHRSGKDTKKWCRGKVGIEHKLEVFTINNGIGMWLEKSRELACVVCGKVLDRYYGFGVKPNWYK